MDKLLIVGVDTLVGTNLALALAERCEVLGVSRRAEFKLAGCRLVKATLHSADSLADSLAAEAPHWIVYCGPVSTSSWDRCDDFSAADDLKQLDCVQRAARQCGGRLTLVSTDAVFGGPRLFHRESFPVAKNRSSVCSARELERSLSGADALVIRTHAFGHSAGQDTCVEQMWCALNNDRPISPSGSRYATPILATDLADLLWQAHRRRLTGVYHMAGAERASMWQFATALAAAGGKSMKVLRLAGTDDDADFAVKGQARCGAETSLDSRKLQRELGSPLPLLRDGIARFVEQANSGYRDRLAAAFSSLPLETSAA